MACMGSLVKEEYRTYKPHPNSIKKINDHIPKIKK
jgi:hypothetical protein